MTPLAQRIVADYCQPVRKRRMYDPSGIAPLLAGAHCFEVSEVRDVAMSLVEKWVVDGQEPNNDQISFLPAPRTWIEAADLAPQYPGARSGALFVEHGEKAVTVRLAAGFRNGKVASMPEVEEWPLDSSFLCEIRKNWREGPDHLLPVHFVGFIALVNTPRVIGRVSHQPHAGLQRKLLKAQPLVGKFPLHAWTEIKLSLNTVDEHGRVVESGLTGERCLHFCRAHLRIRKGQVEIVRSHWRGNPALGMKRSRYILENS